MLGGAGRGAAETEGAGCGRGCGRSVRVPVKMREPGSRLLGGAGRGAAETEGAGCGRETDEDNGCETRGVGMRYVVVGAGARAGRGATAVWERDAIGLAENETLRPV